MKYDLESCPFCGAIKDVKDGPWPGMAHLDAPWYIQCRRCHAGGPIGATKERAISSWNKRVTHLKDKIIIREAS